MKKLNTLNSEDIVFDTIKIYQNKTFSITSTLFSISVGVFNFSTGVLNS